MRHNSDTQTSDSMPSGVYLRNSRFCFRKRIPKDIAEIPNSPYFEKDFHSKALGTSDRAEARMLGANMLALLENEWAEIRARHKGNQPMKAVANFATQSNNPNQMQLLSEQECKSIYLQEFKDLEAEAEIEREEWEELDKYERETILDNLKEEQGGASRELDEGFISSYMKGRVEAALKKHGYIPSQLNPSNSSLLAKKIEQARIEVLSRSIAVIQNKEPKFLSRAFSDSAITKHEENKGKHSGVSIQNLCREYLRDKEQSGAKPATLKKCKGDTVLLAEFFGKDTMISGVGNSEIRKFIKFIAKIPVNRPSGLSLKECVNQAKADTKRVSITTQRNNYNNVSSIFRYAIDREWLDKNPFNNRVRRNLLPKAERSFKQSQTGGDMNKLFGSKKFLKERDRQNEEGERVEGRFWSVLLAIYHGMRINESAQLLVEDVKEHKGITYLAIREEDDKGVKMKTLKTIVSVRDIPVHNSILNLGFLEYVNYQRKRKSLQLFPELKPNKIGNTGASVSKWFGRLREEYLDCTKLNSGDKGLHSFRHKVVDILRSKNVEDEMRYHICGWERGMSKNAGFGYGRDLTLLPVHKEKVDLIEFEGFDESLLSEPHQAKPVRKRKFSKESQPVRKRNKP